MSAQWTGDIVGEMHLNGITSKALAERLQLHPKYVSTILNGHRSPVGAEKSFRAALSELISEKHKSAS